MAEVRLGRVLREWARIGLLGFGGPPAHLLMMRRRFVDDLGWIEPDEFQDAIATTNLLPGPASTQLAIFCGWRVAGVPGALVGGLGFIVPGLVLVIAASAILLGSAPPKVLLGVAAAVAAGVPAVAVHAATGLVPASWARAGLRPARARWTVWVLLGGAAAAAAGALVVLVVLGCGLIELVCVLRPWARAGGGSAAPRRAVGASAVLSGWLAGGPGAKLAAVAGAGVVASGSLAALAWTAFKVGALSFGGGFVIIPLMQADALRQHWLTHTGFGAAVALGQITPGPVVHTVAAVGYAAGGRGLSGVLAALLAAAVAFGPSFILVIGGARHQDRLRADARARAFLNGAGPSAVGAIFGSAVPLSLAIGRPWQLAPLGVAAVALFVLRRSSAVALVAAGVVGAVAVTLLGLPLPG